MLLPLFLHPGQSRQLEKQIMISQKSAVSAESVKTGPRCEYPL